MQPGYDFPKPDKSWNLAETGITKKKFVTTNAGNHYFQSTFCDGLTRVPSVDSVNTWLIHSIQYARKIGIEFFLCNDSDVVGNSVMCGYLGCGCRFVLLTAAVFGKCDGHC